MRQLVLALALLVSGCSLPNAAQILEAAGKDNASWCSDLSVTYGGGAIVPGPGIPVVGSYGHLYVGRTNQPGSTVTIDANGCKITHGKEPTSRVEASREGYKTERKSE